MGISMLGFSQSSSRFSLHFQQTTVTQGHPRYYAKYTGLNSLSTKEEIKTTLTSTLFLSARLWKHGYVIVNPEMAGGEGVSEARGIAGFTNGESFRVGDPKPVIYLARGVFHQYFSLGKGKQFNEDDINTVADSIPQKYIHVVAGKFCLSDYFDANTYSHDPREQFLNWSLMSNGAWDYAANTRGYTHAVMLEAVTPKLSLRAAFALLPTYANGPVLNPDISKSRSMQVELEKSFQLFGHASLAHVLVFQNAAGMFNYKTITPHVSDSLFNADDYRKSTRKKLGVGLNIETALNPNSGIFFRAGWNDGKNETWAYTEIDQSISAGYAYKMNCWKSHESTLGVAIAVNGISKDHRAYLAAGGYGFIIGDGELLRYKPEFIAETYYNLWVVKNLSLALNYQLVVNPAYNPDRGPVHVGGLRAHIAF